MKNIKNPVGLARRVLEATEHNLLVGEGANKFAAAQGITTVAPETLVSPEAVAEFEEIRSFQNGVARYLLSSGPIYIHTP